jgi:hypothetical protein
LTSPPPTLGATGERTDLNRGSSHAPIRSRSAVSDGGGDTTLASQPTGDMRESSQPPPTRVCVAHRTPPSAEDDIECGNVPRARGCFAGDQALEAPRLGASPPPSRQATCRRADDCQVGSGTRVSGLSSGQRRLGTQGDARSAPTTGDRRSSRFRAKDVHRRTCPRCCKHSEPIAETGVSLRSAARVLR